MKCRVCNSAVVNKPNGMCKACKIQQCVLCMVCGKKRVSGRRVCKSCMKNSVSGVYTNAQLSKMNSTTMNTTMSIVSPRSGTAKPQTRKAYTPGRIRPVHRPQLSNPIGPSISSRIQSLGPLILKPGGSRKRPRNLSQIKMQQQRLKFGLTKKEKKPPLLPASKPIQLQPHKLVQSPAKKSPTKPTEQPPQSSTNEVDLPKQETDQVTDQPSQNEDQAKCSLCLNEFSINKLVHIDATGCNYCIECLEKKASELQVEKQGIKCQNYGYIDYRTIEENVSTEIFDKVKLAVIDNIISQSEELTQCPNCYSIYTDLAVDYVTWTCGVEFCFHCGQVKSAIDSHGARYHCIDCKLYDVDAHNDFVNIQKCAKCMQLGGLCEKPELSKRDIFNS